MAKRVGGGGPMGGDSGGEETCGGQWHSHTLA
jgi:hypothetical protein